MPTYKVKICDQEVEINKIRSRAIKAYCTDCSGGQRTEVKECPCTLCPLYPFRGYVEWNPKAKRKISPEERERMSQRLKNARQNHNVAP